MNPLLTFSNLSVNYDGRSVLKSVSGRLHAHESIGLIGPNACGKSTLFKALVGLLPVAEGGRIEVCGTPAESLPVHSRACLGLSYMRQTQNVFPTLTGRDNLEVAFQRRSGLDFKKQLEQVAVIFEPPAKVLTTCAGLLSAGERQTLAFMMVLLNNPKVLLLDEPLAGLSGRAAAQIMSAVKEAQKQLGFACLIIEHRVSEIQPFVKSFWSIRDGALVYDCDPASVQDRSGVAVAA